MTIKIFILFTFFLNFTLNAQFYGEFIEDSIKKKNIFTPDLPDFLNQSNFNWVNFEFGMSEKAKDSLIYRIKYNKYLNTVGYIFRSDFHFIDFDFDGKIDIVFTGRKPVGSEADQIGFFKNFGDSLDLIFRAHGSIFEINRNIINKNFSFGVWNRGCCANQVHKVEFYELSKDKEIFLKNDLIDDYYSKIYDKFQSNHSPNFIENEKYNYIRCTFIPSNFKFEIRNSALVISDSAILETNPNMLFQNLYSFQEMFFDDYGFNIKISSIKKDTKLFILEELIINGEKYFLTLSSIEIFDSKLDFNEKKVNNLIAWIKAKDISIEH